MRTDWSSMAQKSSQPLGSSSSCPRVTHQVPRTEDVALGVGGGGAAIKPSLAQKAVQLQAHGLSLDRSESTTLSPTRDLGQGKLS